jgi:hypothetical protein
MDCYDYRFRERNAYQTPEFLLVPNCLFIEIDAVFYIDLGGGVEVCRGGAGSGDRRSLYEASVQDPEESEGAVADR